MSRQKTVHHIIRRERKVGSRRAIDGRALIPVEDLPEGHSPAKILPATTMKRRRGVKTGEGPVYRQPEPGMMVEEKPYDPTERRRK